MTPSINYGSITLTEAESFRQTFETASWYTDYSIAPGTYQVTAYYSSMEALYPYLLCYKAQGTVTASLFVNRLLHLSSNVVDKDVGEMREVSVTVGKNDPRIVLSPEAIEANAAADARMTAYYAELRTVSS